MNKGKKDDLRGHLSLLKHLGLVGHFFHSFDNEGLVEWQGLVVANPEPGWYLVQTFSWVAGEPYNEMLVPFTRMESWYFYRTNEEMVFSYEHGAAHRHVRKEVTP